MYWIDSFGDGFAVWYCGDIVELCESQEKAEQLISEFRGEDQDVD